MTEEKEEKDSDWVLSSLQKNQTILKEVTKPPVAESQANSHVHIRLFIIPLMFFKPENILCFSLDCLMPFVSC